MRHSARRARQARSTAKYLVENLPLQIVLVISLLALVLVFCIPFVAAQSTDPATDPPTDTDSWNPLVKVSFYGLGSLVRTTTDQNGREVFNVIQRRYNEVLTGVDGANSKFPTMLPMIRGSECLYKNGVRQVHGIHYVRIYTDGPWDDQVGGISFLDGHIPQVLPDGSEDVLVIDYDPVP